MTEVTLPNGDLVVFKDPSALTERARRTIKRAVTALSPETIAALADAADNGREITASMFTAADLVVADELNDASAVALIDTWTTPDGVTVTPTTDALLDLPSGSYDALIAAANPLIAQLSVNTEPNPDPTSPTKPVSA